MAVYITKKIKSINIEELGRMMEEATYSGERFLVQTEAGISCAIVSNEDLKVLEEVDP